MRKSIRRSVRYIAMLSRKDKPLPWGRGANATAPRGTPQPPATTRGRHERNQPPERTDLVLSADVPYSKVDVLVLDSLDVETNGWDGGDNLAELELVQDCGLTSSVQTHHQNAHLLLGEETLEHALEGSHGYRRVMLKSCPGGSVVASSLLSSPPTTQFHVSLSWVCAYI